MKKTITIIGILVMLLVAYKVFAWVPPQLATTCDEDFSITLAPESNQVIEFSFNNFSTIYMQSNFGTHGTHTFSIPNPSGTILYARYASDHNAKGQVAVSTTLCHPPVVNPPSTPPSIPSTPDEGSKSKSGSCAYGWNWAVMTCNPTKVIPYVSPEPTPDSTPEPIKVWKCEDITKCKG